MHRGTGIVPAQISVIIPTLDAEPVLPACLAALIEGLAAGLIRELIITDGGSRDATQAIAEAAGAVFVCRPGLARRAAAPGGDAGAGQLAAGPTCRQVTCSRAGPRRLAIIWPDLAGRRISGCGSGRAG